MEVQSAIPERTEEISVLAVATLKILQGSNLYKESVISVGTV
jgi:hypothetical protein